MGERFSCLRLAHIVLGTRVLAQLVRLKLRLTLDNSCSLVVRQAGFMDETASAETIELKILYPKYEGIAVSVGSSVN